MLFLLFLFFLSALAAPFGHEAGVEHIILLNTTHHFASSISNILASLSLSESHKDVKHIYNNTGLLGFSAKMNSHCLNILANTAGITHIEPVVRLHHANTFNTSKDSSWGLERISTASASMKGDIDQLDYTYTYANNLLGSGADIYILDTGIFTEHVAFGGRAVMAWSFDGVMTDDDGHGTHVAGIAAGQRVGVAQGANVYGVRAMGSDGQGVSSDVVKGLEMALQNHRNRLNNATFTGSIISLSLGTAGQISSIQLILQIASTEGMHIVVAADNAATDACLFTPASSGGATGFALTVGSIKATSDISSFSNTGSCVDIYAPGEDITSAWPGDSVADNDQLKMLSGTSMATPFVTGLLAYAMADNATLAKSPALMKEWIKDVALSGIVGVGKGRSVVEGDMGLLASNGVVQAGAVVAKGNGEGFIGPA
ncbi:peptidase S8/S53 domain-containing protein [Delphinella strobiligena]|nr:peptidase S8/S53 domain-containing protein [Delphinella strobiligena]